MIGQLSKLASSGQRFATQGVSGALIASATRGRTVETVADLGGLSVSSLIERVGTGMFTAIDFAISQFATDTAVRADVTRIVRRDLDDRALERQLVRDVAWRSAARGAVSGIPAVIPAAGTAIELAAAVADSLAMTVTEARMVLALAHLRGLDVQATELRRLDIMIVLGMAAGAAEIDGDVIRIGSEELSIDVLRSGTMPPETAVALGTAIGADVVRKVARRRTSGILIRLLPGGISIVAAAWSDWRLTQSVGKQAVEYFDLVAPMQPRLVSARS